MSTAESEAAFYAFSRFIDQNPAVSSAQAPLMDAGRDTAAVVNSNLAVAFEVYRLRKALTAFVEARYPALKWE
jgi:hypothetical protein